MTVFQLELCWPVFFILPFLTNETARKKGITIEETRNIRHLWNEVYFEADDRSTLSWPRQMIVLDVMKELRGGIIT